MPWHAYLESHPGIPASNEMTLLGNGFGLFAGDAVIIMMRTMIMRNAVLLVHDVNNV